MFHLDPPAGFKPFDPWGEVTFYQRHLPHWRQRGATYFVTFRLADSLPEEALREMRAMRKEIKSAPENQKEALQRAEMLKVEKWLDSGCGECLLQERQNREIVVDALLNHNGQEYETGAFVIMPNHVHAIIRPIDSFSLEDILKGRKQWTSRLINCRLENTGPLWQDETYDRIIRDAEHLWRVLQYIGKNPAKAGLAASDATRWVSASWQASGWDFDSALSIKG